MLLGVPSSASGSAVDVDGMALNQVVSGQIKVGRRVLALPAGEWQLVRKAEGRGGSDLRAPEMVSLSFQQVTGNRIVQTLSVNASKNSSSRIWAAEPCKAQSDSYWVDDRKVGINNQFCTRVGFTSGFVDGAAGADYQSWVRDVKARGLAYSPEMPWVGVVRYTMSDYLLMAISFDPGVSGIGPSKRAARRLNDWLPDVARELPAQRAFYESLVAWAPVFATAAQRAFDGDETLQPADYGEPKLPPKPRLD